PRVWHVSELSPAIRPVDCGTLIQFRRDGLEPAKEHDESKPDMHPYRGDRHRHQSDTRVRQPSEGWQPNSSEDGVQDALAGVKDESPHNSGCSRGYSQRHRIHRAEEADAANLLVREYREGKGDRHRHWNDHDGE